MVLRPPAAFGHLGIRVFKAYALPSTHSVSQLMPQHCRGLMATSVYALVITAAAFPVAPALLETLYM